MTRIYIFSTLLLITCPLYGQQVGEWTASGAVFYAQPAGSLNSFFTGTPGFAVKVGQFTESNLIWELKLEMMKFTKANESSLNPLVRDISLKLDISGAAAEATYFLTNGARIKPFITGSAGMYRWLYKRGAHYALGSGNLLDSTQFLPTLTLSDWSAGFSLGLGVNFEIMPHVAAYTDARYRLIVGEIWQTLALGMDNVSTMQMSMLNFGVRYTF